MDGNAACDEPGPWHAECSKPLRKVPKTSARKLRASVGFQAFVYAGASWALATVLPASREGRSTEALRVQRASLRCEAVELGREPGAQPQQKHLAVASCRVNLRLQGCVGRGDELVSENLRLRTEAASLEEAEERRARTARCSRHF